MTSNVVDWDFAMKELASVQGQLYDTPVVLFTSLG